MADDDSSSPPLWQRLIWGRNLTRTLIRAAVLGTLVFLCFRFVILPARITGCSMEPTYHDGKVHFINRLAFVRQKPQRGDVVAVRFSGRSVMLLKRVIGLPGERIAIKDGVVFINGDPLDEPYVKFREPWQLSERKIGDDEYYVIGDNRGMEMANHVFGAAQADRIIGRALW
jgi:signal peptidase I